MTYHAEGHNSLSTQFESPGIYAYFVNVCGMDHGQSWLPGSMLVTGVRCVVIDTLMAAFWR